MQILVKIPFLFNDKNGHQTYYGIGVHDVHGEIANHPWVLSHAEIINQVEVQTVQSVQSVQTKTKTKSK